uniref:Uncharacterized protein n=1 Tax=Marseillevirus LCMAC102 TaxID=2506603 RepID=A0A481YTD8_9VIRU|nr:MAG: hypothetical protein LCMAC102_03030 [Marseillevirus LCMAC102]
MGTSQKMSRDWRYGGHLLNPTADPIYIPKKNKPLFPPIGQKIYTAPNKTHF